MSIVLVTGSAGLVGSTAALHFGAKADVVVGIDNDMRGQLFGASGSVAPNRRLLKERLGDRYAHYAVDVRDSDSLAEIFATYGSDIEAVIHTAAQPSHDWAAGNPAVDFSINATGTFRLLEAVRQQAPQATFVYLSTSKVYGDRPNRLPFVEKETRWELPPKHPQYDGIDESFGVDQCAHSLFGASKLAGDVFVQEYGRYYELKTGVFRSGCVTGPRHAGVEQHGFLSHLVKTAVRGDTYTVFGYHGKQVRDNIHADDLVAAIDAFVTDAEPHAVFNIGGGRRSNCSVLEALSLVEERTGQPTSTEYVEEHRRADHRWYISDCSRFRDRYPEWTRTYGIEAIVDELVEAVSEAPGSNG